MGFQFSNFSGDPFAISTVSFGFISWIIAIGGLAASLSSSKMRFTWWGLVYEILLIAIILLLYLNNNIELYKFTLVGLLSVAFVYTTNSTNMLIYSSNSPARLCCAAGCIFLSALNILWVIYFGGHPESPTNQFIDSFSVKNNTFSHGQLPSGGNNKMDDHDLVMARPGSQPFPNSESRQSQITASRGGYMSSSQLNGLENFSNSNLNNPGVRQTVYNNASENNDFTEPVTTFRYKAKALYSYDANPDDINEISFLKDEILEVDDIDGKWWQAKRSNGEVGICPSNYVKILD